MDSRQGQDRNKEQPESASHSDLAIEQEAKPRLHSESDIHSSIRRGSTRQQKTRGNESLTDDQSAEGGGRSSHRKYKRWEGKATRRQERPEIELNWRQHGRDSEPESNWRQGRSQDGAHRITYSHQSEIDSTSGYKKQKSYRTTTYPTKTVPHNFREANDRGSHNSHTELQIPRSRPRVEKPTKHYFLRSHIEELHQADDESVSRHITQNESGFLHAFKHERFLKSPKILKQLVTILYKLQNSNDTQTALRISANLFGSSGEHALFMFHLQQLMREMVLETKTFIRKENLQCLYYLTEIGKFCFEKIPRTVQNSFPIQQIRATADSLVKYNTSNDAAEDDTLKNVEKNLQELEMQYSSFKEVQVKLKPKLNRPIGDEDIEPPEHYSALPILPTPQEINDRAKKPYLRPNIVKGEYRDWQHYLDVQFRLLREDFVGPLREGINEHLHNPTLKGGDVRVYRNVKIQQPACLETGIGFHVSFNSKKFSGVNWEYTDRFKNGSFLCLSTDRFKTIHFATIADRTTEELEKGIIVIQFESTTNGFELCSNADYTIVESVAYLEAYRHVLEKLQAVSEEHEIDMMPFYKYIVKSAFDSIPLPRYLNHLEHTIFNLSGIVKLKNKLTSSKIDLTQRSSWPKADETDLDPSQMQALQAALTQEISVIQGPPGTGKTYVGLKIVKAFLANKTVWDPRKTTPILVVCYTNHALDQFLEGILSDGIKGQRTDVTRIGARSKSEQLQELTLRQKAYKANMYWASGYKEAKERMISKKKVINGMLENIEKSTQKVFDIHYLENWISVVHYQQLRIVTKKPIKYWLGLQYEVSSSQQQIIPEEPQPVAEQPLVETYEDIAEETKQPIIDAYEASDNQYRPPEPDDTFQIVPMSKDKRKNLIKRQLHCGLKPMTNDEAVGTTNLWSLDVTQRWRLYLFWHNKYIDHLRQEVEDQSESYQTTCEEFYKTKHDTEIPIIRDSDIVGMTTTGAAKHNYIIKAMCPKIVVVEEAAEIFEPHIFTSLSPTVQQLVLIGDHQQLRPKPTYYELEKKYDFNVSLFERLAKNDCPVQTLNIQHRMRPEIASLITPAIYKELHNHDSVLDYDHVQGIGKNLFFITHTEPELAGADDRRSHSNPHEAKYLGALCDYLLKQGYKPEEITILTLYKGQLLVIKRILHDRKIKDIRTAVVDDFQGEENRIILLSLVRSNNEQKIGFVGIDNRVCVALSRAKMSLFLIGNVEMLRDKVQTVWPKIIEKLTEMGSIGEGLPLHCHIHQDQKIDARVAQDFLKCPEGGCQKKCDTRLPCGHVCPRMCHPYDIEHLEYKCLKICKKQLSCGHSCENACYECSNGCKPCKIRVSKYIPTCGHLEHCFCSDDPIELQCSKICDKILECGHFCQRKCSQVCTKQCMAKVDKELPCGHTVEAFCYLKEDAVQCSHPCGALLDCEHPCTGTCYSCNRGRLHKSCALKCNRILTCGHPCEFPCTVSCPPCTKQCNNFCTHSCCGKKCFELCAPCMEPCDWSCPHFTCTQPCGLPCNRPPCNEPCDKRLNCGHLCIGLCGEVCPKLCRVCDKKSISSKEKDARFILLPDCNHIVEVEMLDQWMSTDESSTVVTITTDTVLEDTEKLPHSTTDIEAMYQKVSLKVCPLCNIPIRKCFRYGNDIKSKFKNFERIKMLHIKAINSIKVSSELDKMKGTMKKVSTESRNFISNGYHSIETMMEATSSSGKTSFARAFPIIAKAKIYFLCQILILYESIVNRSYYAHSSYRLATEKIVKDLKIFKVFIMQKFLSQQQLSDAECEMRRLTLLLKATKFLSSNRLHFKQQEETYLAQTIIELEESGWKREKISEENETAILKSLNDKFKTKTFETNTITDLSKDHEYERPDEDYYEKSTLESTDRPIYYSERKRLPVKFKRTPVAHRWRATDIDSSRHTAYHSDSSSSPS